MLPPVPFLEDYGLSPYNGFLPDDLPIERLSDRYYQQWEEVVANLQALLLSKRLKRRVNNLPIVTASRLRTDAEWRRAYMLLSFMTHAYIWGGDKPEEVCRFPSLTRVKLRQTLEDPADNLHTLLSSLQISRASHSRHLCRCMPMEFQTSFSRRTHRQPREFIHTRYIYRLTR